MDCSHFLLRRARVLGFAAAIFFDLTAACVVDLALGFFTIFFEIGLTTALAACLTTGLAAGFFLDATSRFAFV